jgi:hypothetical protein
MSSDDRRLLAIQVKLRSLTDRLLPGVGVVKVTLGSVLRWLIANVVAVVVIVLFVLVVVVVVVVVVLVVEVVDNVLLLWLSRLLLLARDTSSRQLSNGHMTSNAFVAGAVRMNHLQFRSRRV